MAISSAIQNDSQTVLNGFLQEIEVQFQENNAGEIRSIFQVSRIGALAVGIIFTAIAAAFTMSALSLSMYGMSIVLLVPAAALFMAAFDCYRVIKCSNIIIDEAVKREGNKDFYNAFNGVLEITNWKRSIVEEVNQGLFLSIFASLKV